MSDSGTSGYAMIARVSPSQISAMAGIQARR
jgi:hypothetical protein